MFAIARYNDPSPSRLRYRFERLWLKRSVRQAIRFWLPLMAVGFALWTASSDPMVRGFVQTKWSEGYEMVAARPELQVTNIVFPNVSDDLQQQILTVTGLEMPISALKLDVLGVKAAIESLDAVKTAEVRVLANGELEILTVERTPVIVWRDGDILRLVDADGHRVADIARRTARSELPLIVGLGAELAVTEAVNLVEVATPIVDRLRGLVRVGERRWDLVLDRGQTIMLPEFGAVTALRRVMALHQAEDLLNRDVTVVDMRNGARPVLRLSRDAITELRRLRFALRGEDT